jgi:hypothetical protein
LAFANLLKSLGPGPRVDNGSLGVNYTLVIPSCQLPKYTFRVRKWSLLRQYERELRKKSTNIKVKK